MRIPKLLLTICAVSVGAGLIPVRATDTPAQAAARAALEQKLRELDAQSSESNTVSVAPAAETTASSGPGVMATAPPAPATTKVLSPGVSADTEAQAQARAALQQKMAELSAGTAQQQQAAPILINASGVVPPPSASQPVAVSSTPLAVATPPPNSGLFMPVTPTPPAAAQTPARVALPLPMTEPSPASAVSADQQLGLQPIVAPPLPISAQKEAQLQALNARYLANQISPQDYHKQRAAILGQPDFMSH